jgi:uncharacterized protein YndB with AHSA1/START domain
MQRVEESIEIARPIEAVWAFVADPANDPQWCSKVESVEAAGPSRWQVSHKPMPFRPPVALALEHVELDAPHRLRMREEDDVSVFEVEYRLEPAAAGTRLTQVSEIEWKRYGKFVQGQLAKGVRRDVRAQLFALRRILES